MPKVNDDYIVIGANIYHNSSAALSINGNIVCAFNEDRFVKKKNEVSIPINSIKSCLKFAKVNISEVDELGITNDVNSLNSFEPSDWIANFLFKRQSRYTVEDWNRENELYWKQKLYNKKKMRVFIKIL